MFYLELEHRSPFTTITEVDPSFFGKGPIGGAERSRQGLEGFTNRSYFTIKGKPVEEGLKKLPGQYYAKVMKDSVYNMAEDPAHLVEQAQKVSSTDSSAIRNEFEKLVLGSGYKGYTDGNTVAWFSKLPVSKVAQ